MAQTPYRPAPEVDPTGGGFGVQSSTLAFGGGVAAGLGEIGDELLRSGSGLAKIRLAQAGMMNELYANDASVAAMKRASDLYADFARRQGRAAVEELPNYKAGLDQIYKETLSGLPNKEAKSAVSRSLQYLMSTYYGYGNSYATSQFKDWQTQSANDRTTESRNQAVIARDNPTQRNAFIEASVDEQRKLLETQFADPETITAAERKTRGQAVEDIVASFLDQGDVQSALGIYEEYKDGIDSANQVQILGKLRPVMRAQRANLIVDIARGTGNLNPQITLAQVQAESNFEPGALGRRTASGERAHGIMQIMPATAKMVAAEMGLPFDEKRLLTDPAYNIAIGTHYMEGLLNKYDGNYVLALAAYNAGPGAVNKWLMANGDPRSGAVSDADWLSKIPYEETKDYVKKILENAGIQGTDVISLGVPNKSDSLQTVLAMTEGNQPLRDEALAQLNQRLLVEQAEYTENQRQQAEFKAAQEAADQAAQQGYMADFFSGSPTKTAKDVALDPRLKPETKRTLINFMGADDSGVKTALSQETASKLFARMLLPEDDPQKITSLDPMNQAFSAQLLKKDDFNFLVNQFTDAKNEVGTTLPSTMGDFLSAMKPQIMKSTFMGGLVDPESASDYYKFQQYVTDQVRQYRAAGKDPFKLFDPGSSEYIGKEEFMANLRPNLNKIIERQLKAMHPPVPGSGLLPGTMDTLQGTEGAVQRFREALTRQGVAPAEIEERAKTYRDTISKLPPVTSKKRLPGESLDDYDRRRRGVAPGLTMNDFHTMDLASQLTVLENLFG